MCYIVKKDEIVELATNDEVYKKGLAYFKENRGKNLVYGKDKDQTVVSAMVDENFKEYKVKIMFGTKGEIKSYTCTCTESYMWKGACKHVVCVLLKIEQESAKVNAKNKMLKVTKNIIKVFEAETYADINNQLNEKNIYITKVNLKPFMHINEEEVSLSFSIGTNKYYMIKNINQFIENINNKEVYTYGKELTFNHDINMFNGKSIKLISFIKKVLKIYNSSPYYKDINKFLYIQKSDLDVLFDMYCGQLVEAYSRNLNTTCVEFKTETPKNIFDLNLNSQLKTITMTYKPLNFTKVIGFEYDYIMTQNFIFRVKKTYSALLNMLIHTTEEINSNTITFENEQYDQFITFVFPIINNMDIVTTTESTLETINTYNMPTVKVYFDFADKNIICEILFHYGEEIINPLEVEKSTSLRNMKKEYEVIQLIKIYGFKESGSIYYLSNSEKIYNFYLSGINEVKNVAQVYLSEEFTKKNINATPKAYFKASIKGNLLEVLFDTSNYSINELLQAVSAYNLKKRYHRFKDGSFIDLNNKEIQFMSKIADTLQLNKDSFLNNVVTVPKYRALYIEEASNELEIGFSKTEKFKKLIKDFNNYSNLDFKLPGSLNKVLREYQKVGYNWLKVLNHYGFGGILADDMGLGKTVQIISLLLSEKDEMPSLVVAPTSLIYNWQKEIEKFAPDLKAVVLSGLASKREETFLNIRGVNVFITTYDTLKRDIGIYNDFKFKFVIADEAQNIKNHLTQNAKSIKNINAYNRFALTGTPVENSLSELWSIFDFIMPGYLLSHSKFTKKYAYPIMKDNNKSKTEELRKQIAPFILRRAKSDVLKELPNKLETTIYAEMTKEQKKLYAYNLLKAKGEFEKIIKEEGLKKSQIRIFSNLTRLKQVCCHPSLFIKNYTGGSGKLDVTLEYIQTAISEGNRLLLFSQFTSMLKIIKEKLIENNISFLYIDGLTPSKERLNLVDKFNSGKAQVFLISLKAGGTGLNLTGANIVIHYDQWWNPAVMNQATDRAHRYGQKNVVQVVNVVVKDSLEEKILDLHNKKRDLTNAVIKEEARFISGMTKEELMEIFEV